MARSRRITVATYPHHVIQRGNNRQAIFFADGDYRFFLECLQQAKLKCSCRIYAYVLMTNHFHLLVEPLQSEDRGRFMQSVGRRYVRYVNQTHHRSGTLWEGRFKSAVVSRDEYLIMCSRYIELNPVRARLVSHVGDYQWTSYRFRALGITDRLLDKDPWYAALGTIDGDRQKRYRDWMESTLAEGEWDSIRRATQQGRVIGRDEFQGEIGVRIGRTLVGEARGRPKKQQSATFKNVL